MNTFLNERVTVLTGDLTEQNVDAVVNAANNTLLGGGGVDGAIHSKGGYQILEQCRLIRENDFPSGLPTGKAVITTGGLLKARFVIHTVGPIYGHNQNRDAELLADSYVNSLRVAVENELETVAFPSISTGAFAYPKSEAAQISSIAIKEFLSKNDTIQEVRLVFFSAKDAETFITHQKF